MEVNITKTHVWKIYTYIRAYFILLMSSCVVSFTLKILRLFHIECIHTYYTHLFIPKQKNNVNVGVCVCLHNVYSIYYPFKNEGFFNENQTF